MRNILFIGVVAALLVAGLSFLVVSASSHREAPFISQDPAADTTDVYAWRDTTDPTKVNLVTNYYPFQEPSGGPNFYRFSDDVLYEIRIDNDGDAREDITYRFRFNTKVGNGNTFLYNTGRIGVEGSCAPPTLPTYGNLNVRQTYSVTKLTDDDSSVLGSNLPTPPVNIGPRSTPSYEALAGAAVCDLGDGIKVFAGQRDDPFFVDLGSVFDLAGLRPFNPAHIIPLDADDGIDGLGGFNVQTIALQVPISDLTAGNDDDDGDDDHADTVDPVIGIWATSSRRETRLLKSNGEQVHSRRFIQVSRLGMPLVNEVVIPLGKKDRFNASQPKDDAQFLSHVTDPELAVLFNALYGGVLADVPTSDRGDLVTVFLTGIPGVNQPVDVVPSEMLRLNTSIPPCTPPAVCSRLGALAVPMPDLAGFPNGRRLGDDVTDIELRAAACGYGDVLGGPPPGGGGLLMLCNLSPNNQLGDGVDQNDVPFLTMFPYVGTPHQGYEHEHHLTPPMVAFGIGSGLLGAGLSLGGVSAVRRRRARA